MNSRPFRSAPASAWTPILATCAASWIVAAGGSAQPSASSGGTDGHAADAERQAAERETARDARETAQARALYEEGVAAAEAANWKLAADRFGRAQSLRPSAATAFNLAAALEHLGRLVEAAELLRATLRDGEAPTPVRDAARSLLRGIEPRLAMLTIRLSGAREEVDVDLDGTAIKASQLDVGMPVDPGRHTIIARRRGEPVEERTVDTDEGTSRELTLEIPVPERETPPVDLRVATPQASAPIAAPSPDEQDGDGSILTTWWFWTAVGVVATGTIVAVVVIADDGGGADPSTGGAMP